jgi:hypothetical protein
LSAGYSAADFRASDGVFVVLIVGTRFIEIGSY